MRDRGLSGYIARPARHRSQPDRCGRHTRHRAVCRRAVGHRLQADPASAMYPFWCAAVPSRRPTLSGNCCSCCWSADKLAQRLALITTVMAAVLTVDELAGVDMFDTQGASPAPRQGDSHCTHCHFRAHAAGSCWNMAGIDQPTDPMQRGMLQHAKVAQKAAPLGWCRPCGTP